MTWKRAGIPCAVSGDEGRSWASEAQAHSLRSERAARGDQMVIGCRESRSPDSRAAWRGPVESLSIRDKLDKIGLIGPVEGILVRPFGDRSGSIDACPCVDLHRAPLDWSHRHCPAPWIAAPRFATYSQNQIESSHLSRSCWESDLRSVRFGHPRPTETGIPATPSTATTPSEGGSSRECSPPATNNARMTHDSG